MQRRWMIGAALLIVVTAVALWATLGQDGEAGPEARTPVSVEFKPGDSFELEVEAKGYFNITNTAEVAPSYLEFKPSASGAGTVSITRCEKGFKEGKCEGQALTVLPAVDLAGWKTYLAGANTSLAGLETGHYLIEAKSDSPNLTFRVRAKP